jgi:hypothetical protein
MSSLEVTQKAYPCRIFGLTIRDIKAIEYHDLQGGERIREDQPLLV